jgi:hypothetical protein
MANPRLTRPKRTTMSRRPGLRSRSDGRAFPDTPAGDGASAQQHLDLVDEVGGVTPPVPFRLLLLAPPGQV